MGPQLDQVGIPGTLDQGIAPDPRNSLRAMVDRKLRHKVVEANRRSSALKDVHITGEGHEFWVDPLAGFTVEEQEALLDYLLGLD